MASLGNSETLSLSKKKKVRRGGSEPIIPATWEMEKGGFWFKSSLGKKLARLAFKKQALIPVMGKHVRRFMVKAYPGKSARLV
jgi:hypothetical protein